MMNKLKLTLGICCLGILLASCEESSLYPTDTAPKPQASDNQGLTIDQIIGREWKLQSFEVVGGEITSIRDGREYSISFTGPSTLRGKSDCNTISASYSTGNNYAISISAIGSTRAFCGSESRDMDFNAALELATSYKATSAWLRIFYDGNKKVLNFTPRDGGLPTNEPHVKQSIGKVWELDSMAISPDGGLTREYIKVPDGQSFTLRFENQTEITGTANCNEYTGEYSAHPANTTATLSFTGITPTLANCGIQNSIEADYYALLERISTYVLPLQSDRIVLFAPDDASMIFKLRKDEVPDLGVNTLQELAGLRLLLTEYGERNGTRTRVQDGSTPSITVVNGAWLAGTGFCGSIFSSDYQTSSGNKVTLSDWSGEPGASCSSYDQLLFNALKSVTSYQIVRNRLELYYDDGASVLVYMKP